MAKRIVAVVILAAAGAGVFLFQQKANEPAPVVKVDQSDNLSKPGVEGVEPDVPPEFDVAVELRRVGVRDALYFTITERHGWYADHLYVEFWHRKKDENGEWQRVGDSLTYLCRKYLDFGATLVDDTTPQFHEFPELDEDMGTSENWRARISNYSKVLAPS